MTSSVPLNFPGGIGATGIISLGNDTAPSFQNFSWIPNSDQIVVATQTGTSTFTYPLPTPPSTWVSGTGDGWVWPCQASIRFRKAKNCMVTGNNSSRPVYLASYDFDYSGQAVLSNIVFTGNKGDSGFVNPTATNTASVKGTSNQGPDSGTILNPTGLASPFTNPFLTWAQLPGNGIANQLGPFIGQEYVITDGPATVTFRGNVTAGGGPNNVKVRWNGANWIMCG
jgi:hypothetical protein